VSRTLAVFALLAILVAGFSMRDWLVGQMLYHPSPGVDFRPEDFGITAEEVFLTTEDGVRIHAFDLPSPGASRALLFLHGNAGNASHRLPNAAMLQRLGIHVLLLDYRGYGRSEGRPEEAGLYADGRAGLAYLTQKRGFPEQRIVLFGRSLGGAVAVDLAQDRELAGLILESTFSSLADAASAGKIVRARAPLLFFHGDRDEIIAYDLGRRLFEAAPEPKAFETLRGAGHNDTVQIGGAPYFERIRRFIDEVAP